MWEGKVRAEISGCDMTYAPANIIAQTNINGHINGHKQSCGRMAPEQCKFLNMILRLGAVMFLRPILGFARTQPDGNGVSPINVMPLPASRQVTPGRLKLDASSTVAVNGYSDARLERAIARMLQRLRRRTGLVLPLTVNVGANQSAALIVSVKEGLATYPKCGEDESSSLVINGGSATLQANTTLGAMRGLETFFQLVSGDADGYYVPFVNIQDKPRFGWGGVMSA